MVSSNRWETFRYVKEKIWNRLQSWKGTTVSRGGKEILIKSVVQSIPSYVASVFLLPKKLCEDIEILMNRFWWLSNVEKNKGIRWMAWNKMCYPKKFGGMGFKRIQEFNVAMLGKQAWRILTQPHSFISRLLKSRYFPKCRFEEAILGNNPSYVWRV
ncbi:putative mitochondrial protein AtMg00310 [Apium graveolens]|uniref:putative mitochondrial protein AtMg00310 n=1 Tax=Apium graveolens TaxID=4045 RepID=UPI003D7B360B